MDKKLVSVIIPIYNVEKFLHKSIESIVNQTYKNLEIILVDDGSSDRSLEICKEYEKMDNRVIVIHKENGGQAEARNYGLDIAQGDYIYFMDSDDYAEINAIEVLVNTAQQNNADMVIADICYVDDEGIMLNSGLGQYDSLNDSIFTADKAACIFADLDWGPWNKLYARKVHEAVRFPVHKIHEDEAIMFQLFYHCDRIVYTKQQLYNYVKRPGSTTSSTYSLRKMDWFEVWKGNYHYVQAYFPEAKDKALSKLLVTAIYNLDNLMEGYTHENMQEIHEIIRVIKNLRRQILSSAYIKRNYKIRTAVATSSYWLYKIIYI